MRTNATTPNPLIDRDPDDPADLSERDYAAREARQGKLGRPVLAVLLTALALACIVWAGVEFYGQQLPGNKPANESAAPAPSSADNRSENQVPTTDAPMATNTQQTPPMDKSQTPQSGSGGGAPQPAPGGTVK